MSDFVIASKIETFAKIGCGVEERAFPQRLLISAKLGVNTSQAAQTKDLSHTVNYAAVCELVRAVSGAGSWVLVEELAAQLTHALFEEFSLIRSIHLTIQKFVLPGVEWVGVEIYRERP